MLIPYNRHLLVQPVTNEDKESGGVILPDGYKSSSRDEFELVTLLAVAPDSEKFNGEVGHTLVVASHMIHEVPVGDTKYFLVPENVVMGVVAPGA